MNSQVRGGFARVEPLGGYLLLGRSKPRDDGSGDSLGEIRDLRRALKTRQWGSATWRS
jgi:hypothetical protein